MQTLQKHIEKEDIQNIFISKLIDSDGENSETSTWLDFAFACEYLSKEKHLIYSEQNKEIGKLINFMINNPGKFGVKTD